jgi:DNA-binding NtrC family response regulator
VRKGYRRTAVADSTAALRAIIADLPDVVLLDVNMPGLTGTDALPAIPAVAPNAAVIMVSGTADADLAKRALAHGAFDYVLKPVDFTYLDQSLRTALAMTALD